ncbi:MAG: hypothetical protein WCA08_10565 [Desulfoferrobacter sp.]
MSRPMAILLLVFGIIMLCLLLIIVLHSMAEYEERRRIAKVQKMEQIRQDAENKKEVSEDIVDDNPG